MFASLDLRWPWLAAQAQTLALNMQLLLRTAITSRLPDLLRSPEAMAAMSALQLMVFLKSLPQKCRVSTPRWACPISSCQAKSQLYCGPKGPTSSIFLDDINNTKWCNGVCIQFRQSFAKETFSYDEHLKS